MGGLFLWVGAPLRVKGHAEVPPCRPRPPGSLELGNLQSRAASLAPIPATQLASPSWVLTKNLGRHPLRLLKVPKSFTSCSLPGLGRCELGQEGPKDRPRAWGGPPSPTDWRQPLPSGSQGTFRQALSGGQYIKKTWPRPQAVTRPKAAMIPQTSERIFLELTVTRLARSLRV